jgi:hypothetical protein
MTSSKQSKDYCNYLTLFTIQKPKKIQREPLTKVYLILLLIIISLTLSGCVVYAIRSVADKEIW